MIDAGIINFQRQTSHRIQTEQYDRNHISYRKNNIVETESSYEKNEGIKRCLLSSYCTDKGQGNGPRDRLPVLAQSTG